MLNKKDIESIVYLIQSGESKPICRLTRRSTKHKIIYNDKKIEVIYDKQAKKLREYKIYAQGL